jgi:hypothetical protein
VPEINLLKPKSPREHFLQLSPKILARLLLVLLVAVALYYAWLFFQVKTTAGEVAKIQQANLSSRGEAATTQGRDELLTRLSQLQEADKLISHHLYWSNLLPALARVTLKTASYSNLEAFSDGTVGLTVMVPNLGELDKFLQVFNNPKFNANFYNITIGAFHKIQSGDTAAITFDVKLNFNPALLHQTNGD